MRNILLCLCGRGHWSHTGEENRFLLADWLSNDPRRLGSQVSTRTLKRIQWFIFVDLIFLLFVQMEVPLFFRLLQRFSCIFQEIVYASLPRPIYLGKYVSHYIHCSASHTFWHIVPNALGPKNRGRGIWIIRRKLDAQDYRWEGWQLKT